MNQALDVIGSGISMNAFFYEFEYEASMLLDKLQHQKLVKCVFVRKHLMTVIMPKEARYSNESDG